MASIDLFTTPRKLTRPNDFFIIGIPGNHENNVNAVFNSTYPNQTARRIEGRTFYTDYRGNWVFDQARRALGYNAALTLISYIGFGGGAYVSQEIWNDFWDNGLCYVCAQGPNDPQRNAHPMGKPICISAGPVDRRTFAFGPGLEFWEIQVDNSSATPQAAARLLQIKDTLQCSWWEVRYRARITAIRTNITHPSGELWNELNGFGRIDVAAAIAFSGTIPPDPFLNNGNVYLPFVP